jgi:hypothetical protein
MNSMMIRYYNNLRPTAVSLYAMIFIPIDSQDNDEKRALGLFEWNRMYPF